MKTFETKERLFIMNHIIMKAAQKNMNPRDAACNPCTALNQSETEINMQS